MEYPGAELRGRIFLSCKRQKHHSREVILPQHALVHVFAGVLEIAYANNTQTFRAGDTVLLPRNQLGRLFKYPQDGLDFKSISVLFPEELLRKHYAAHPVKLPQQRKASHLAFAKHPLLESLFNSLLPYFAMADELPEDIAEVKIQETLIVLHACNKTADQILGSFEEPGKIDLADFMEQNYMFNLSLEKFGYLTGRSLTTFKKDFRKKFNTSPGRWLTQKRLELAHYEIVEKKRRPSEVYVEAGFENLSHFSYAFKRQFGYNPTELQP